MASRELASFARVADIWIRNHNSIMLRSAAFMAQEKKKIRREHNSYGGAVTLCCVSNRSSLAWNHRGEGVRRPFKSTIYNNVRSSPKSLRTLTAWLMSAVIDHAGYLQKILNCQHATVLSGLLLLLLLSVFGGKGQSSAGFLWLINMAESNPLSDCKGNDLSVWELPFPEGEAEISS